MESQFQVSSQEISYSDDEERNMKNKIQQQTQSQQHKTMGWKSFQVPNTFQGNQKLQQDVVIQVQNQQVAVLPDLNQVRQENTLNEQQQRSFQALLKSNQKGQSNSFIEIQDNNKDQTQHISRFIYDSQNNQEQKYLDNKQQLYLKDNILKQQPCEKMSEEKQSRGPVAQNISYNPLQQPLQDKQDKNEYDQSWCQQQQPQNLQNQKLYNQINEKLIQQHKYKYSKPFQSLSKNNGTSDTINNKQEQYFKQFVSSIQTPKNKFKYRSSAQLRQNKEGDMIEMSSDEDAVITSQKEICKHNIYNKAGVDDEHQIQIGKHYDTAHNIVQVKPSQNVDNQDFYLNATSDQMNLQSDTRDSMDSNKFYNQIEKFKQKSSWEKAEKVDIEQGQYNEQEQNQFKQQQGQILKVMSDEPTHSKEMIGAGINQATILHQLFRGEKRNNQKQNKIAYGSPQDQYKVFSKQNTKQPDLVEGIQHGKLLSNEIQDLLRPQGDCNQNKTDFLRGVDNVQVQSCLGKADLGSILKQDVQKSLQDSKYYFVSERQSDNKKRQNLGHTPMNQEYFDSISNVSPENSIGIEDGSVKAGSDINIPNEQPCKNEHKNQNLEQLFQGKTKLKNDNVYKVSHNRFKHNSGEFLSQRVQALIQKVSVQQTLQDQVEQGQHTYLQFIIKGSELEGPVLKILCDPVLKVPGERLLDTFIVVQRNTIHIQDIFQGLGLIIKPPYLSFNIHLNKDQISSLRSQKCLIYLCSDIQLV